MKKIFFKEEQRIVFLIPLFFSVMYLLSIIIKKSFDWTDIPMLIGLYLWGLLNIKVYKMFSKNIFIK